MKKLLLTILLFFLMAGLQPVKSAFASTTNVARSSAKLALALPKEDTRAATLSRFLTQYDSPLAPYAQTFIDEADKNQLDWKLVAAISGNESAFGRLIPYNSYNGWGYGVYGNNVRRFASWNEGIAVVSKAIRDDYLDKWGATNVHEIGDIYAEDPMWASKVTHYIDLIENFESTTDSSLSISI